MAVGRKLGVAVIGAGLIGVRRAREAARHPDSQVVRIADINKTLAASLAGEYGARSTTDWKSAVNDPSVDIVIAATPNVFLSEISIAALAAKKHVLVEKPMGRNLPEALAIHAAALGAQTHLKVGFNHRHHPAIARAHDLLKQGTIGRIINIRAHYGHGGRAGYENEWRGNAGLAGGGELTDQGVHIADLIHWFAGIPSEAFGVLQTAVWPIAPLEDNGFALFQFADGSAASFHTSWTQWKNEFSFHVFGTQGALAIDGLGKSYGVEQLSIFRRRSEGPPDSETQVFDEPDNSWAAEWLQFMSGITNGTPYSGTSEDGVISMRMIAALYESATTRRAVPL